MQFYNSKILLYLMSIVFLSACATTTTKVERGNLAYQPKDKDCVIQFYKNSKPKDQYNEIGKIESHIGMNTLFGGLLVLENEGYKELNQKACDLGGDAVIIEHYFETSVTEINHLHIWATVVKFAN